MSGLHPMGLHLSMSMTRIWLCIDYLLHPLLHLHLHVRTKPPVKSAVISSPQNVKLEFVTYLLCIKLT
jgi:hypothetical protein